ncbi:MAG: DUF2304 domain-containing protein [Coriobacteriaceae bacterium]|nr:DUF2304 domain-containing protein [Coriobacteriaceae bacterium]
MSAAMSLALRILLFLGAIALFVFLMRSVRKANMRIEDSLFWIVLSAVILLLSVVPDIATTLSDAFGFIAPVNFIFLLFIFILLVKGYLTSKRISELDLKIKELTQQLAIDKLNHHEREERED